MAMGKWLMRSSIMVAVFVALYLLLKFTWILTHFKIAAGSGEPALRKGSTVWASRLKKPGNNRFVCFRYKDSMFGPSVWIFRQVAAAGDVVQIKSGTVYINGSNADEGLNLYHYWQVAKQQRQAVEASGLVHNTGDVMPMFIEKGDSVMFIAGKAIKQVVPEAALWLQPEGTADPEMERFWGQPWNPHFFGPVTVPQGHIFVMGDNRDNARDSRYIGFVPLGKVVAVVL